MLIIPKIRKSQKINSKLSLPPLLTLQKHPSAKNLLDKEGKPITNKESNINLENINNPINSELNKEEKSNSNDDIKYQIVVNFSNDENPLFVNNDYSIKNEKISLKKNNITSNKKKQNNSLFDFIDLQKKLDKDITMDILSGKGFPSIEQKLSSYLKN